MIYSICSENMIKIYEITQMHSDKDAWLLDYDLEDERGKKERHF